MGVSSLTRSPPGIHPVGLADLIWGTKIDGSWYTRSDWRTRSRAIVGVCERSWIFGSQTLMAGSGRGRKSWAPVFLAETSDDFTDESYKLRQELERTRPAGLAEGFICPTSEP